jgi:hypothetical protein
MSADALHVRRTRQAIYGPPISAVIGLALAAIGIAGLALRADTTTSPPSLSDAPAVVAPEVVSFALIDVEGHIYRNGNLADPIPTRDAARLDAIVGAARAATGGLWLADANGYVAGRRVPVIGSVQGLSPDRTIVGIAATADRTGYRLVANDGSVFPFNAAARGEVTVHSAKDAAVGIASSTDDGYWIAQRDGSVGSFSAPRFDRATIPAGDYVVGIASTPRGRGYWLLTAGGRVVGAGVRNHGDLTTMNVRAHATAIAAAPGGGYWITTDDGRVYSFGSASAATSSAKQPLSQIVAIVPG